MRGKRRFTTRKQNLFPTMTQVTTGSQLISGRRYLAGSRKVYNDIAGHAQSGLGPFIGLFATLRGD